MYMSDDPLRLGGLDAETIDEAVQSRKGKKGTESARMNAATAAKKEERLSSNQDPGPSAPHAPPPPPQVEPVENKSFLLDKIQAYRERFPHLKSRNKVSARSTIAEMHEPTLCVTPCCPRHAGLLDHWVHLVPLLAPAIAARGADVGLGHVAC